ncbi:MAG: trypsin-like peptidase domain-containing protein [Syntrophorhabdaceae bacterium]|nr:trypsin-like peptidase domain-containing protein [Syntrophorhabdaceae bacterium]
MNYRKDSCKTKAGYMFCTFCRMLFTSISAFSLVLILSAIDKGEAREDRVVEVVEAVSKAIVNIRTEEISKNTSGEKKTPFLRRLILGEESEEETFENIGSGVVMDPRGIIVTNEHLISRAISIKVKFINGKEYDAYVLGSDPEFDMALLKITDKTPFPYLKVSTKKKVRVGERVIVIGNPYGLSSSVSSGVISALGRNIRIENRVYANLIQTDAAINPGNSGGALLDIEGNPIGIVTAIYGEGKGIGFAIPIEDVMNMVSEFLGKETKRPILGIFGEKKREGNYVYLSVNSVIPNSPAERNGISAGDRIIELNRKKIKEGIKLQSIIRNLKENETIQIKILKSNRPFIINLDTEEMVNYRPSPADETLCSMRISDIAGYPKMKYKLKEKNGVVVTKLFKGGVAETAGLKPGDVILKINNYSISNRADFDTFMLEGLNRNYILYQVKRGDNIFYVPIKLDVLL